MLFCSKPLHHLPQSPLCLRSLHKSFFLPCNTTFSSDSERATREWNASKKSTEQLKRVVTDKNTNRHLFFRNNFVVLVVVVVIGFVFCYCCCCCYYYCCCCCRCCVRRKARMVLRSNRGLLPLQVNCVCFSENNQSWKSLCLKVKFEIQSFGASCNVTHSLGKLFRHAELRGMCCKVVERKQKSVLVFGLARALDSSTMLQPRS